MCEYCDKKKKIKSGNFAGGAELRIYKNGFEDDIGMLEMQGNGNIFKVLKEYYCPRFDINYCPMCGKRLGKVNKNGN